MLSYQERAATRCLEIYLSGARRVSIVMPHGAGKLVVASEVCARLNPKALLVVTPSPDVMRSRMDRLSHDSPLAELDD